MMLPVDEFNGYLDQVFKMLKRDGGGGGVATTDHRSFVEDQMRRLHG